MPAIVFHGWASATHPYCGRVTGERPWGPGTYEIPAADAAVLVRDFDGLGPNGGPAFTLIEPTADAPPPPVKPARKR